MIRRPPRSTLFPTRRSSDLLMWWAVTQGLRPLEALRRELARRPPGDDSPVAQGLQTRELAPLVGTLNQLLHRVRAAIDRERRWSEDRKSTRLNSSHSQISYAVFCLKKKKQ